MRLPNLPGLPLSNQRQAFLFPDSIKTVAPMMAPQRYGFEPHVHHKRQRPAPALPVGRPPDPQTAHRLQSRYKYRPPWLGRRRQSTLLMSGRAVTRPACEYDSGFVMELQATPRANNLPETVYCVGKPN